jgi:archaellum component FlaF (FlaF/FlaG flagellin family)
MLSRNAIAIAAAVTLITIVSGCHISLMPSGYHDSDDTEGTTDPDLLAVVEPSGESYTAGEAMAIRWEGSEQPDEVTIDLYLSGTRQLRLAQNAPNAGSFEWLVPTDYAAATEVFDEYQIVVSGYRTQQAAGELLLVAYSERFAIVPKAAGGLSDVTVSRSDITVRLTDNGQEIDGDTVDLYLNGTAIALGHVLVGGGTTFPLELRAGDNVLEVYAVNEGSVSPNTALLDISDVTEGVSSQEWRLAAGETGRLTITSP